MLRSGSPETRKRNRKSDIIGFVGDPGYPLDPTGSAVSVYIPLTWLFPFAITVYVVCGEEASVRFTEVCFIC